MNWFQRLESKLMSGTAIAIRHVHFEDLGTLEPVLRKAGYALRYHDAAAGLGAIDPLASDLVVVLGGPVGVYESDRYPFLDAEKAILKTRLAADLPTCGICLGAQLVAAALDAEVAPMGMKEIGFSPLALTEEGAAGPLRRLAGVPVLHWHGDSFAIPRGARNLAGTRPCSNQAFSIGANILGLQFHPEFDANQGIEPWLIGHAAELAMVGVDPRMLRDEARRYGAALGVAARAMFQDWLDGLKTRPRTS